jgi:hypothetical protein
VKEFFVEKNFGPARLEVIQRINVILADYAAQGYRLSLRQLYYQLVARAEIENTLHSYKRLGDLVSDARLAGMVDWDMIEDRGRETIAPPMWKDPAQIVDAAARQFAIDRWADQPNHVEVMVEKAALEGVLIPVCRDLGIRFTANRGYSSQSTMYESGKRLEGALHDEKKDVFILYLGDHDPSGVDMTRDVRDRLSLFADAAVEVDRLALNMDQVQRWRPPENPAKTTDSRYRAYILEFGASSWELDAVEPATLADIVRTAVAGLRDDDLYNAALERENTMKAELQDFVESYRRNQDEQDQAGEED